MEELRSTEVLDREILEDARKKAHKILGAADEKVKSQTKRWQKKTDKSLAGLEKTYKEKEEKIQKEILARLPLDRRRLRSETTEAFLKNTMNEFLGNLSRDKILDILKYEFVKRLEVCLPELSRQKEKPVLFFGGMKKEEAQIFVKEILSRPELSGGLQWELKEDEHLSSFPAVILDIPELRINASVENAASALLGEKRAELAAALLGEGVLND